ncbi:MAG: asparagine synthase (glutamine-hydrolyzing) [Vicingaceae bacterium]
MCGIAGIYRFKAETIQEVELTTMTDTLVHRGPDDAGIWINKEGSIGFGHRRLSIIDLDKRASQPFKIDQYHLTYNGEIYNYLELKDELQKKGHQFRTNSDTEVLLRSYLEWGESCLSMLDGMFSFVICDENSGELFGARDRFGEKPFFYFQDRDEFLFASEIKAIATQKRQLSVSLPMVHRYLVFDLVENPDDHSETFFKDIKRLKPAHSFRLTKSGQFRSKAYWEIDEKHGYQGSISSAAGDFLDLIDQSVELRLRSDVTLGSSLSGGLDSSAILACISQHGLNNFQTFTARFKDDNLDEGPFIDKLAETFTFNRNDIWPDASEMTKQLEQLYYYQEEPFGSASIYAQWEIMKKAKECGVTVLLDGQGGDEILGGYEKYVPVRLGEIIRMNPFSGPAIRKKAAEIPGVNLGFKNILTHVFPSLFDVLRKSPLAGTNRQYIMIGLDDSLKMAGNSVENPFYSFSSLNENLKYDTLNYGLSKLLRFSDRNSMAHSREVRLPFLSHKLVEFVFSLPSEMKIQPPWTKRILREAFNDRLPSEICWRRDKKGFAPPQEEWLSQGPLREYIKDAESALIKERVLKPIHHCQPWQVIMTSSLFNFGKSFGSK